MTGCRFGAKERNRGPVRRALLVLFAGVAVAQCGCDGSSDGAAANGPARATTSDGAASSDSLVRAERRAYDGAPPVIPHMKMGADCVSCHTRRGIQFGEMGFAPPMPHSTTPRGAGAFSRCEQCHVYATTADVFAESSFVPLRQDLRRGRRLNDFSPPVLPHPVFMRENCAACHTGPAAREEIRCSHPERARCLQCHVPQEMSGEFSRRDSV